MNKTEYETIGTDYTDTSDVPKGKDVYYRCLVCGAVIPSVPRDNIGCGCGNVFVDIDYWRLSVEDFLRFEVVRRIGA